MREIISAILIIIGSVFMFIAALGVVRMPDLYLRMSASTKSATLGVATVLLSTAIYFNEISIVTRAIFIQISLIRKTDALYHIHYDPAIAYKNPIIFLNNIRKRMIAGVPQGLHLFLRFHWS